MQILAQALTNLIDFIQKYDLMLIAGIILFACFIGTLLHIGLFGKIKNVD